MIVKIVHYDTAGEVPSGDRIPQQIVMFDGVDEVEYEKVTCRNAGELRKLASCYGYGHDKWYGQPLPESSEGEHEALLVRMARKGVEISLVAIGATMFFMNDSGKTIDKVMCR